MKAFVIAAGALLMGTSAFAYDGGKDFDGTIAKPEKAAAVEQSQQMKKAVTDVLADAKADAIVQPASAVTWDSAGADAKWQPVSAVTWDFRTRRTSRANCRATRPTRSTPARAIPTWT